MRRFSADYLRDTRRGMWGDTRRALDPLSLPDRERVLDVGCGSGAFTDVLREEGAGEVVGLDADSDLLTAVEEPRLVGDAVRLPVRANAFDLVVCQALLINLPEPSRAVAAFARASSDRVAAVEPDNGAVAVESTVEAESALAARAREAYVEGASTDVTLGDDARHLFREEGLEPVETSVYYHTRRIEPPYRDRDLEAARRKVRASRLRDARATLVAGDLTEREFEALEADWRSMGRTVLEQMQAERYRRVEIVPFYVTVGRA